MENPVGGGDVPAEEGEDDAADEHDGEHGPEMVR